MTSRPPRRPPPPPRRWGLRLGILGGWFALMAGVGVGLRPRLLPDAEVLPGLTIDGEAAPSSIASARAMVETHARALGDRKVRFHVAGAPAPVLEIPLRELGLEVDVDGALQHASHPTSSTDLWTRYEVARDAREGRLDVPLVATVDRPTALRVFETLKESLDTSPVSARLDLDKHQTIPEKDGRYLDADGALAAVDEAVRMRSRTADPLDVEIPVATFAPRVSSAFLKQLDISTVVAEYETYFSRGGEQQRRGKNIDTASQKIDGLVISPGELVSFNNVVGERSEANGFQKSWEIFKGEMVEGVGGGTCQVASTFHAVAFFGGLEVLERLPHSRPSAYIPMGLDSTVVYPGVDLKIRNPHPFPVVVHAKTEGNKLRLELLGASRPAQISFGREVLATIPYKRKIVEEPGLSGKKVVVKQHGIKGYRIKRSRQFVYANGERRTESTTDTYPPTTEIYQVPVGFDVSMLPALPGGEGEDADLGGNPSATPVSARGPSSSRGSEASAENAAPPSEVEFVDAPGAHAPTSAQANPAKSIWMKR